MRETIGMNDLDSNMAAADALLRAAIDLLVQVYTKVGINDRDLAVELRANYDNALAAVHTMRGTCEKIRYELRVQQTPPDPAQ
jgi:hypothetical protein